MKWVKASRSYGHGECVEWTKNPDDGRVGVRDSKNPDVVLWFDHTDHLREFFANAPSVFAHLVDVGDSDTGKD